MADIPSNIAKMNDAEIASDAPLTEALFNKISANLNALIDITGKVQKFTSSGTFTVPENVTRAVCYLIGGGGGGGGGGRFTGGNNGGGGAGGGGSSPRMFLLELTPNETLTVNVGTGGTAGAAGGPNSAGGNGGNGGTSEVLRSGSAIARALGASGGAGGGLNAGGLAVGFVFDRFKTTFAGGGGSGFSLSPGQNGESSNMYPGGVGGGVVGSNVGASGGGGGASELAAGGNGGLGAIAAATAGSGASGTNGSGGGGGGGADNDIGTAGSGGEGGNGFVIFMW